MEKQLTFRAALAGMLLGGLMSLSNLYVVLKTGWSLGVAITAGILAFGMFSLLHRASLSRGEFGMLENNAMQSVASAAGFMTGGGTAAAIPAYMMITGQSMDGWAMFFWIGAIAILGVVVAIPMKQQMIDVEQLAFPSGIAAAETVRALHGTNPDERGKARLLAYGGIAGASLAFFRDVKGRFMPFHLPERIPLWPGATLAGRPLSDFTLSFDLSFILFGAGAIMGFRAAWSMLLGGVVNFAVLAPMLYRAGIIPEALGYRNIVGWSVWFGSSMVLTSGLLSFGLQWRTIARAMRDVGQAFSGPSGSPRSVGAAAASGSGSGSGWGAATIGPDATCIASGVDDAGADATPGAGVRVGAGAGAGETIQAQTARIRQVPMSWFFIGLALISPVIVFLEWYIFGIKPWMGVVSVVLGFFISIVACRATGETDTTPSGALGKVTQLTFGVLDPGNAVTNLMTANVTGGMGLHAADLLTDLKSGFLLRADPRQQFWAQFLGVLAGSVFVVPAYRLLIPDASVLGSDQWPAPAAQTWKGVAVLLAKGLETLHPTARLAILVGGSLGVALVLLETYLPRYRRFIPSPAGLGVAFTMPAYNSLSIFLGALVALVLQKRRPVEAERLIIPVSSGLIAGESILGVLVAALIVLHVI